jgi:hypothetical protein
VAALTSAGMWVASSSIPKSAFSIRLEIVISITGIVEMAKGFYADVPDLSLVCDEIRYAGSHAIFVWTFTGHDAKTGNLLKVRGWEEWELDDDLKVKASLGRFDVDDYTRQGERV